MLFDPAVGAGAFFRAANVIVREKGLPIRFADMDIDPDVVPHALTSGLSRDASVSIWIGDFVLQPH